MAGEIPYFAMLPCVSFIHVRREVNSMADAFAKEGITRSLLISPVLT